MTTPLLPTHLLSFTLFTFFPMMLLWCCEQVLNMLKCPAQGFQTASSGYISTLSVILVQNMSGVAAADHMTGTVVIVTLQELCDSNTCSRPRLYCCSSSTLPPLAQLRLQRSGKIRLLFCTVHSWPAVNNYVN